jgi:hypothetical protein
VGIVYWRLIMLLKKIIQQRQRQFSAELSDAFSTDVCLISEEDIDKSKHAMDMLCEYIRYCYFDHYMIDDSKDMVKYCRLLMHYELCNQQYLVMYCKDSVKKMMMDAMACPTSLKTVDLAICFSKARSGSLCEMADDLMTYATATNVRAA